MDRCPKCGHRREAHETHVHAGICPACGVAYAKWQARAARGAAGAAPRHAVPAREPLWPRIVAQFCTPTPGMEQPGIVARAVLLAALLAWTLWFAAHGVDWEVIGGSFLHGANLAFHEFGHLAFRPFGEFMTVLGGSLFQLLLPLALAAYFVLARLDTFAGSVALWWCGQNLVDLAPYIGDAEYRLLPLVGGAGEESHDWGNLLTWMDAVERAPALARASFGCGIALMCLAIGWGGWLLWRAAREARLSAP